MMTLRRVLFLVLSLMTAGILYAQQKSSDVVVDYLHPKQYVLGGIKVKGVKYLGEAQILALTGLREGMEITVPGDVTASVVSKIWAQKHFSDVSLNIDSVSAMGDTVYLALWLQERPRVSRWNFQGIKNSEQTELQDRLSLRRNVPLSDYVLRSSVGIIKDYFKEKGFLNADVNVIQVRDTMVKNAVRVTFVVDRKSKVKIKTITFEGNDHVPDGKLIGAMAKTRDMRLRNIFKTKKFNDKEYENDKQSMLSVFNEAGYRDARIVKDSIYYIEPDRLGIKFVIDEGKKYYFRNITWTGNSLYTAEQLDEILMIKKGDVYDVVNLEKRLFGDPKKEFMDIHTLYADQGYIFFNIIPVETNIVGDSVDVELRMVEGKPATFNKIIISGNTITNEKVVRRQLFTKPGYLYSQSMLERSLREIASMGNFDPEQALDHTRGYSVIPNQMNNTVDISYNLVEKPNSQFELSIRFQTNAMYYTAASVNFIEPWLFGKKPTSFNLAGYYTRQTNSYYFYQNTDEYYEVYGIAASLGSRLKWPDSYFVLYHELSWQTYNLHNWNYNFLFENGRSNNISYKITLARNSTDQVVYPREGSDFQLSLQLTPPYSLFRDKNTDYASMTDQQRYRWIEYHKWTFKGALYVRLFGDLVLMTRAQFGYLGYYNKNLGYSPFEGYQVGGDGMSGYNTYGSEIIALRGYQNYSLTPVNEDGVYVGHVYDKFTIELRYPVILQPQSTIYVLAFLEGGNCWEDIREFNPFQIKRSAGVGVRVMLPMIGLLGVDWGWGFDPVQGQERGGSNFHFVIGQQF